MSSHGLETGFISDVLLPLALAVIMFGMGLGLTKADFRRVAASPRAVLVGLTGQLVLLPLLGAGVVAVFVTRFDLSFEFALGVLVLAAVPGGATSNVLTFLARGDTALSISLTSVVSIGAALTTPAALYATSWLLFGDAMLIRVDFVEMALLVLVIVAVPVLSGMAINTRWPGLNARVERPLRLGGMLLLAVLIAAIIHENRAGFWGFAAATVPAALALNVAALATGVLLGWLAGLRDVQRRCLAIEVGFQNGTLGIVLAVSQLGSAQAALVPGFYSLVMFATGGVLASYWMRRAPAHEAEFDVVVEAVPVGG